MNIFVRPFKEGVTKMRRKKRKKPMKRMKRKRPMKRKR